LTICPIPVISKLAVYSKNSAPLKLSNYIPEFQNSFIFVLACTIEPNLTSKGLKGPKKS